VLLSKLQERRGPQQNPQVKLIYVEPRGADPRVIVITQGGTATGEDRMIQGKIAEDLGIRKAAKKTQILMQRKKDKSSRKQGKSSRETKGLHQKHDQK
jgi:hypothetical protein